MQRTIAGVKGFRFKLYLLQYHLMQAINFFEQKDIHLQSGDNNMFNRIQLGFNPINCANVLCK
jgi:hypothetical protein